MQKRIDDMVEFVLHCGESSNEWHGDTFDSLTRKIIPDSLAMDQCAFEVVRKSITFDSITDKSLLYLAK